MAVSTKKVDLTTAKITETPTGGSIKEITTFTDSLSSAVESYHGQFVLAASATDVVVSLGNITTCKVFSLSSDGPTTSAKLNGDVNGFNFTKVILFNTNITSCTVSNSDPTNSRVIEIYIATDTD